MARRRLRSDDNPSDCGITQSGHVGSLFGESFFKIMLGEGFPAVMYLPPVFAKRVVQLDGKRITMEDSVGQRWSVTLKSLGGSLAFALGWNTFVLDHDVKEGELLIFKYTEKSHFVVDIYGTSGCLRKNFKSQRNKRPMAETFSGTEAIHPTVHVERTEAIFNAKKAKHGKQSPPNAQFQEPCMMVRDMPSEGENVRVLLDLAAFEMEEEKTSKALIDCENVNSHFPEIFPCEDVLALPSKMRCSSSGTSALWIYDAETIPTTQSCSYSEKVCCERPEDVEKAPTDTVVEEYETKDYGCQLVEKEVKEKDSCKEINEAPDTMKDDQETVILEPSRMENMNDLVQEAVTSDGKDFLVGVGTQTMLHRSLENHEMHAEATETTEKNTNSSRTTEVPNSDAENEKLDKKPFVSRCNNSAQVTGEGGQKLMNGKPVFVKKEFKFSKGPYGCGEGSCESEEDRVSENAFIQPTTKKEKDHIFSPLPKAAPHHSSSTSNNSFSAEVKSLHFMVWPPMSVCHKKKRRVDTTGQVKYLKDPEGREWAILLWKCGTTTALTSNWDKFCTMNFIQPGDICHVKLGLDDVYEVEIAPSCG